MTKAAGVDCRKPQWAASSEFGTYRLCKQRRFRRACASAQSRQNLRCSLIQVVSQEEPSDRKPDPWPLWMAGHAQLKFVMTECSKTQIRLARPRVMASVRIVTGTSLKQKENANRENSHYRKCAIVLMKKARSFLEPSVFNWRPPSLTAYKERMGLLQCKKGLKVCKNCGLRLRHMDFSSLLSFLTRVSEGSCSKSQGLGMMAEIISLVEEWDFI